MGITATIHSDGGLAAEAELYARGRVGQWLRGKYHLDRVLGVGGMATVYAATHRNGKELAIKVLHPGLCVRTDIVARFLREGHAANKVKHHGAVSVLDDDVSDDGAPFLVMELLEGRTVHDFWASQDSALHPAWVVAIISQLLEVMAAAHASGVIHRDLKPENLVLLPSGELKVLDFGIARFREAAGHTTTKGTLLGTPAFMAPEQALAKTKEVDERTDLWAIGSIAYALLVGEVVHPRATLQETLIDAATRPAPRIETRVSGVPREVAAVFDCALQFQKEDRWPSATAMREALVAASLQAFGVVPGGSFLDRAPSSRVSGTRNVRPPTFVYAPSLAAPATAATMRTEISTPTPLPMLLVKRRALPEAGPAKRLSRGRAAFGLALAAMLAVGFARNVRGETGKAEARVVAEPEPAAPALYMAPPPPVATISEPPPAPADIPAPKKTAPLPSAAIRQPASRCAVPYTIDPATRRKVWKVECL